ncbi:metallophosphoesterase, partial [bacterium]|nr:metallophosphoesterase [bacterium]
MNHPDVNRLARIGIMVVAGVVFSTTRADAASFTFAIAADMRNYAGDGAYNDSSYFRGVCEAIAAEGSSAFLVVPGDLDPPDGVQWTVNAVFGSGFPWYPVAGNHETETPADMTWLRSFNAGGTSLPGIVNAGPSGCVETTFSFDYENCHFVVLNQYYDGASDIGTDGDVVDALYAWLEADLAATTKQHIFVIGHEPAFVRPDMDNGRVRHLGDSLDEHPVNRDRFWALLSERGVAAYLCGHTHNTSVFDTLGVLQVDAGHSRGLGDTGAASSYVLVHVTDSKITYEIYRDSSGPVWDYQEIVHIRNATVLADAGLFLEGPYAAAAGSMAAGTAVPLTSPYPDDPRTVSSIPSMTADWVLVQLRRTPSDTAAVSRSVFLRTDGRLMTDDGASTVVPLGVSNGDYYLVIRHRNHVSMMGRLAEQLNSAAPALHDFRIDSSAYYGTGGVKELESGVWGLWSGDVNQDGNVTTTDYTSWYNSARLGESGY